MSSLDGTATTALLLRAADVVLPLITGNPIPIAITTGTLATTAVVARYSPRFDSLGGQQESFQKIRRKFFWLASMLGIFLFVKYPISSIYIVLLATAAFKTGVLVHLPLFHGWPLLHVLVGLLGWFLVCVMASLTEDAIHFAMDRAKNAIKRMAYSSASIIGKALRYSIVTLKNAIDILFAKLVVIPLTAWPWVIKRLGRRVEEEHSDDLSEEASLSDSVEGEDSEVNLLAEDYDDEYHFVDKPDCVFHFEEKEDFGFLSEQQNDVQQVSPTIRRSGRLFARQKRAC